MFTELEAVRLKSGEEVGAAVITGPEPEWAERLNSFLGHKGGIWAWQIGQQLTEPLGLDSNFYVLHRDGLPFSHLMTSTVDGVGLFGHVYTVPDDRGQGAASLLMQRQMAHFKEKGGRALYLGTGYDTPPFHIYRKQGFVGVGTTGNMTWTPGSLAEFENDYFAAGETIVLPMDWPHWPGSAPLFISDSAGYVRNSAAGLLGRSLCEGPLLPLLHAQQDKTRSNEAPIVLVAQKMTNRAVVGLASRQKDPLWPETEIVDVYCHAAHWKTADELLMPLLENAGPRLISYVENGFEDKARVLKKFGFKPVVTLPEWLPEGANLERDVVVFEKRG